MYLSKLRLDMHSKCARNCIRNCQDMHRSIQQLFHSTRQESGVLYRFNPQKLDIYVLSKIEPDTEVDMTKTGIILLGVRDLSKMEQNFSAGQYYRFDLLAEPSKKQPKDGHKNSQRRFLRTVEERTQWLQRKSLQSGFELLQAQEELQILVAGEHDDDHGGKMKSQAVRFQGILRIQDKELFHKAWSLGIGPGKSYGQGMLMLRAFSN